MASPAALGRQCLRASQQPLRAAASPRRGLAATASGSFQYQTGEAHGVKYASRDVPGPTTTLAIVSKAGTRYQPLPGYSDALEKFAFKSTTKRSALRITREIELLGGKAEAYHTRENLVLQTRFLKEDLPYFAELLAEVISKTRYTRHELNEDVLHVIKLAQQNLLANPSEIAVNSLHSLAFHRGLGEPLSPTSPALLSKYLDAAGLADFSDAAYSRANIAVVANGAADSEVAKWVREFFGDTGASVSKLNSTPSKYHGGEERIAHGSGNSIVLGFPGTASYTSGTSYKPEIAVLAQLLGGESSIKWSSGFSLLAKVASEFPGTHISTVNHGYSDAGLLSISITGKAADISKASKAVVGVIKKVAAGEVSEDDVKKAVALAKFETFESGQSTQAGLEVTGNALITGGKAYQIDEVGASIDRVSVETVKAAAKTLLDSKASVATVGDLFTLPFAEDIGISVYTSGRRKSHRTKRIRYTEEDDDDLELSTAPRSQPARQSRLTRPGLSYREDSDDSLESDFEDDDGERDEDVQQIQQVQQSRLVTRKASSSERKRRQRATRSSKPKPLFELFKKRKPNNILPEDKSMPAAHSTKGHIPPWQTLPYHVLLNIMQFAAYPLYGQASRSTGSIGWLLETSLLCKSFHEACSSSLLLSPPLYPSDRAHRFIRLLQKDLARASPKYSRMVRCLDIEVKNLLTNKSGINLEDLIAYTPLLQRLRLYHNHDDLSTLVWAQPHAMKGRKWSYPKDLAAMLSRHSIKLTSFEWNGRFARPIEALTTMQEAHSQAPFVHLKHLSFLNITYPEKHTNADVQLFTDVFLTGVYPLLSLTCLTFRHCDILSNTVMSKLPPGLRYLEITNCSSLTSEGLSSYLSVRGSSLLRLHLIGNQTMSLGFMPCLKSFCPRLQDLYIDLSYIDPSSYRDREPLYDELLPNGQPTWPSTLVNLDLEYLRQFSAAEAEAFFTSLVDAAPDLFCLRRLSIKAIVKDVGWRDRAKMRHKWMTKLTEVFLCRKEPQLSYPPVWTRTPGSQFDTRQARDTKAGRRSGRLKEIQDRLEEDFDTSDAPSPVPSLAEPNATGMRQGTCGVVELTLSDQRPSQDQYNEGDFLDDEMSGDEDFRA
ncbi:hypothetical protein DV736_g2787, partial [Chaetothyriales sp. CBS 134916]